MIIVTGGAGFIGSAVVWKLNQQGIDDILVVDHLGTSEKWQNLASLRFDDYLTRDAFAQRLEQGGTLPSARAVIHLGACSATTERDVDYLVANNEQYTRSVAQWCLARGVRMIYASSAATYGDGALGYGDDDATTRRLRPLNAYGYSKQRFDLDALRRGWLDRIVGLKFFNVFGPNEYHKGDMTSVVFKAFHQIRATGTMRLFRSTDPQYPDGGQMRDFVYVKDVVEIIAWLVESSTCGLFNLGTGRARSWNDLARAVFAALDMPARIEYIDMPEDLRGRYQNFTQADMTKLRERGCPVEFPSLEDSVRDYVRGYLATPQPYLSSLG